MTGGESTGVGGAAVLVLREPGAAGGWAGDALGRLESAGFRAAAHELSERALASDRAAPAEIERALDALRREPGVDPERVAVLGAGRGGTLAFLVACTRRVAACVDVDGPVLHPVLSPERPTQPLELALNLEGAFLGVFADRGPVSAEERVLLSERLTAAARPFELVILPGAAGPTFDVSRPGYDAARAAELWRGVLHFLGAHLAAEPDLDHESPARPR